MGLWGREGLAIGRNAWIGPKERQCDQIFLEIFRSFIEEIEDVKEKIGYNKNEEESHC